MSTDRGSFEIQRPCSCAHCETNYGDQAESDEQREVYRLRTEIALLRLTVTTMRAEVERLRAERDRAELHQKTATTAAHEQLERADRAEAVLERQIADNDRLRGLIRQAEDRAPHCHGDCHTYCPWCDSGTHTPDCPAFAATGVVR